jgi:NADPH:quinone reductase-like Zn-dependent oxidoreductase
VLRLARISPPEIAASEVLLRVHAAGMDRGAWHLMTGTPYLLRLVFGIGKPKTPVRGREVMCKERSADLERLTELIEAGQLTPSVDRTYPLDQVPQAMRHLAAGQARGKIAITT